MARDDDVPVELAAHTLLESLDAIRAFAGDDITTAVLALAAIYGAGSAVRRAGHAVAR